MVQKSVERVRTIVLPGNLRQIREEIFMLGDVRRAGDLDVIIDDLEAKRVSPINALRLAVDARQAVVPAPM